MRDHESTDLAGAAHLAAEDLGPTPGLEWKLMAEFCWGCLADHIYPEAPDRNELRGLCKPGETIYALCEGCGWINVDHEGRRVDEGGGS